MKNIQIKKAFTLAEVLITLGIIGVVASMTIPTLVANYNQRAWDTSATVFNRKLEEALKTMNTQQTLAGHTTTESFVEELSRHFKTNKICTNDKLLDCFSDTVYWGTGTATPEEVDMSIIKTSRYLGQKEWKSDIIGVQFANGVSALIAYNPLTSGNKVCSQDPYSNQITGEDCLAILYDTSGAKNPNTAGKDLRANSNVTRLGSGCTFEIGSACYTTLPFKPTPISKAECESLKVDLGIKGCQYDGDYWAGAVKACGGVGNLPTMEQLADIANYLYNTDKMQAMNSVTNVTRDDALAKALGFNYNTGATFYIWSSKEYTSGITYDRYYEANRSSWHNSTRTNSFQLAVCLED